MLTLDALRAFGANVDEGLARCMNNEAFYLRLVKLSVSDANFARLNDAIAAWDLNAGFEAAHALKGVLANLSLTAVLTPVVEITELLRQRTETDYAPLLDAINEQHQALAALCRD